MVRSLIMGGVAFAAAFVAAQQFDIVRKDIDRYNELATMSGSPTLARKAITTVLNMLGQFGSEREKQAKDFVENMIGDVIRYARIKGM
jgi:hypothetical protein